MAKIKHDTTINTKVDPPGSTSNTISIASFQKGTIAFSPVKLKSSSMKSSDTSQKYSWPGKEQNQLIQVNVDVGVEDAFVLFRISKGHIKTITRCSTRESIQTKQYARMCLVYGDFQI